MWACLGTIVLFYRTGLRGLNDWVVRTPSVTEAHGTEVENEAEGGQEEVNYTIQNLLKAAYI